MNSGTWHSLKSPIMTEIRKNLKKTSGPGEPTLPRKEANRTWREDFLGVMSDDQKAIDKERRQKKAQKYKENEE